MIHSKASRSVYPLLVAYERAEFCENISTSARGLSELLDQQLQLYAIIGPTVVKDIEKKRQRITDEKRELFDLIIKATITGVTITSQVKPLDDWMNDVRDGAILDVFTEEGLVKLKTRLEKTWMLLYRSLDEARDIADEYKSRYRARSKSKPLR